MFRLMSPAHLRCCADVTGDEAFLRDKAWPVLSGVAEWVKSRVTKRRGKYEISCLNGYRRAQIALRQRRYSQIFRHEPFCLTLSPLLSD